MFKQAIILSILAALLTGLNGSASAQVTFEWATVGNAGNAADDTTGYGSVANEFRIAKHEVTNDQYAEFLNAVAATDTNFLFSTSMGTLPSGGITRSGSSGSFTYSVKANMGNKPLNLVSFFNAMRFVNWLHNDQPTGAQDASTTEDGVYAINIFDGLSETRAGDARFFIPTENEWYKAAYHQPSVQGGDADDYWLYATASNGVPTVATANAIGDIGNPGTNVANYDSGADWNGQDGNATTVGSAGPGSESFYGTSDQGGNVLEWNETVVFGSSRGLRGGSWSGPGGNLRSSFRFGVTPFAVGHLFGFRVASSVFSTVVDLDVKPGNCPNMVNPTSRGAVPIAILGSLDFDVAMVDADSLTLARADGLGTSVSPFSAHGGRGIVLRDVATSLVGEPCACNVVNRDRIDDLVMKFSTTDMRRAFQLNGLPRGTSIELVLRGTLQDGTEFEGVDCIVIPGTERSSNRRHFNRRP